MDSLMKVMISWKFPLISLWFPYDFLWFPMISHDFLWISHGFPQSLLPSARTLAPQPPLRCGSGGHNGHAPGTTTLCGGRGEQHRGAVLGTTGGQQRRHLGNRIFTGFYGILYGNTMGKAWETIGNWWFFMGFDGISMEWLLHKELERSTIFHGRTATKAGRRRWWTMIIWEEYWDIVDIIGYIVDIVDERWNWYSWYHWYSWYSWCHVSSGCEIPLVYD